MKKQERKRSPVLGYSLRSSEPLASYDPESSSWRTLQGFFHIMGEGQWEPFSERFPKSGMIANGQLLPLVRRVTDLQGQQHGTKGKGSGLLPTPRAYEGGAFRDDEGNLKPSGLKAIVQYGAEKPTFPTPNCSDAFTDKLKSSQQKEGSMHSVTLPQKVKMFPTPRCGDVSGGDRTEWVRQGKWQAGLREAVNIDTPAISGQLCPEFVEWLMGFDTYHTHPDKEPRAFKGWEREEDDIPRLTTEKKYRVDRLKALGNAVVPQCIAVLGRKIKQYLETQ